MHEPEHLQMPQIRDDYIVRVQMYPTIVKPAPSLIIFVGKLSTVIVYSPKYIYKASKL
jgi:hypothetical protein